MRKRVFEAVERLNYVPNEAARALKVGRSAVIAVVLSETTRHGYAATLQGIEEAARAAGYSVLINIVADDSPEAARKSVNLTQAHNTAGTIVLEFDRPGEMVLSLIAEDRVVVSVGGADPRERRVPHAFIDDGVGAEAAVDHLLDLGHETVHLVAIPSLGQVSGRVVGWERALVRRGAPVGRLVQAEWTPQSGYLAVQELMSVGDRVTAVLCGNDEVAFGVIRGLEDLGLDVPSDVSVIGFDDIPVAQFWKPALTTVRQDFVALGHRTFALLQGRLDGLANESMSRSEPELIVRSSTGPARQG